MEITIAVRATLRASRPIALAILAACSPAGDSASDEELEDISQALGVDAAATGFAVFRQDFGGVDFGRPSPWTPITGDFNGDGLTDYARLGDKTAWVFYSNGSGGYTAHFEVYEAPIIGFGLPSPWDTITGDFNGDGKTDYARLGNTGAWVFFGKTIGFRQDFQTYEPPISGFGLPSQLKSITGDFNGDGKTDYARLGDTGAWVFPGNGERGFVATFENYNGLNFGMPSPWQPITGAFSGGAKTSYARLGGTSAFLFVPR